jgi:hypothetical protein
MEATVPSGLCTVLALRFTTRVRLSTLHRFLPPSTREKGSTLCPAFHNHGGRPSICNQMLPTHGNCPQIPSMLLT